MKDHKHLPLEEVVIHEVGPRDGFQMVKDWIPTELKLEIIKGLIDSNIKTIQLTSFVNPKAVPQMKDAAEIVKDILSEFGPQNFSALVPNFRGAQNAYAAGLRKLEYVISVSEKHNMANVGMDHEKSFIQLKQLFGEFPDIDLRPDFATFFSCPFNGKMPLQPGMNFIRKAIDLGITKICLSDTTGMANPIQTQNYISAILNEFPAVEFHVHFHDTFAMAMLNYFMAAQLGIKHFETSIAGLGGCPFAPGASGNLATEDLVNMFESIEIDTGINLQKLLVVAKNIKDKIPANPSGRLVYYYTANKKR